MTTRADEPDTAAPPDDPRVVQALEAYLLELEAGAAPDRAAYLAEYADVAGPLADCLDGLDLLRGASPGESPNPLSLCGALGSSGVLRSSGLFPSSDPARRPASVGEGDKLGDFRLVREVGRGGMGVVYEAEDLRLHRLVAVKVLPAAAGLGGADLRRFRHEARAAALLAHPHIVPVYSVGSDRGVHYFSMQLIRGRSLAELMERAPGTRVSTRPHPAPADRTATGPGDGVAPDEFPDSAGPWPELPDDPRFAAGLALQAADALAHAHAAGVVHRDIKPANLLLDGAGHLWVADFGLAYLPGASRLTRPGAMVGSLLYMSPEQVDPSRGPADHRADLYGLGATLYELLARRPVVDAVDHAAAIARILTGSPPPPRRLNPRVSRDLETVVLTLLEKDPARRYPSAQAVADDLRRVLAGEPVRARRPGVTERAVRWATRHARAVAAAGGVLALTAVALAVALGAVTRERNARVEADRQSRAAVDDLYTHFAEQWLSRGPNLAAREREFLAKARAHYDRLAADRGSTREDRLSAAAAARRSADIAGRLGEVAESEAGYAAAGERLRALAGEHPGWPAAVQEAAVCATDFGNLLRSLGRLDDAGREYDAAAVGFRGLVDGGSAEPFDRAGLAGVENNRGLLARDRGEYADAEACFRAARTGFARLASEDPARPAWVSETAAAGHNLADALADTGRLADAERAYRESLVLRVSVADGAPSGRREQARTRTALAALLARRNDPGAVPLAAEAVQGWGKLVADFPDYPADRVALAWALRTAAEADAAAGRSADALLYCDKAAAIVRPLGDALGAAGELARTRYLAGTLHLSAGRRGDAEAALGEAVAAAERAGVRTAFDRQTRTDCRAALDRLLGGR